MSLYISLLSQDFELEIINQRKIMISNFVFEKIHFPLEENNHNF